MAALPAIAAVISFSCVIVIARDSARRHSPDKIAWIIAFALFSVAAGSEVIGSLAGWTPMLVRTYYLSGAVLVVGFLGLGELYLLAPRRIAAIGPGVALLMVAVASALVIEAPIDMRRLVQEGWHALERGPALIAVTVGINSAGTAIVVGGAVWSAVQFWRRGIFRHRMIGCLLIAAGTLIVASGGTLTRLGQPEYLYIAMAVGVAVIFAGYLEARRREVPEEPSSGIVSGTAQAPGRIMLNGAAHLANGHGYGKSDPAMAFLIGTVLVGSADDVARLCRMWSIEPVAAEVFNRDQARRVWALRLRLPEKGQTVLDQLPAAVQAQVADLYHDVLVPGVAEMQAMGDGVSKPT